MGYMGIYGIKSGRTHCRDTAGSTHPMATGIRTRISTINSHASLCHYLPFPAARALTARADASLFSGRTPGFADRSDQFQGADRSDRVLQAAPHQSSEPRLTLHPPGAMGPRS